MSKGPFPAPRFFLEALWLFVIFAAIVGAEVANVNTNETTSVPEAPESQPVLSSQDGVPTETKPAPEATGQAATSAIMGKDTCLQCHPDQMKNTVHSRLHPKSPNLGKLECETCHGSGEAHVAAGGGQGSINAKPSPKVIKDACAACHPKDRSQIAAWNRDAHHQNTEMSCLSCHDIHDKKEFSQLRKTQVELCFSCHQDKKAEFARPFHHPVGEGKMECSDCHDPHTNDRRVGRPAGKNAICTKCHTEVKGPFMWEHKATTDEGGCLNCHQPHGGTSRKLLKMTENALCLQCHQEQLAMTSFIGGAGSKSRSTQEHSRMPALQGRCGTCHVAPIPAPVGNHTAKVSAGECSLCHTSIKGIDHTLNITRGRCVDCHTDIHGSNHSRAFLD